MYDYQAGKCKYFPLDDVRISQMMKFNVLAMNRGNAVVVDFIEFLRFIAGEVLWRPDC
jgi:hypothetical protein